MLPTRAPSATVGSTTDAIAQRLPDQVQEQCYAKRTFTAANTKDMYLQPNDEALNISTTYAASLQTSTSP